jgi:hypothetical protein
MNEERYEFYCNKRSSDDFNLLLAITGSVAALLATTIYPGNRDKKHKL